MEKSSLLENVEK